MRPSHSADVVILSALIISTIVQLSGVTGDVAPSPSFSPYPTYIQVPHISFFFGGGGYVSHPAHLTAMSRFGFACEGRSYCQCVCAASSVTKSVQIIRSIRLFRLFFHVKRFYHIIGTLLSLLGSLVSYLIVMMVCTQCSLFHSKVNVVGDGVI